MPTDATPAEAPAEDPPGIIDDGPLTTVDALVQLSFLIQRVLSAIGAEHDLSIIQIRLLGVLRDRQPGMLALGSHLGLDKSSITGLVSRAERRGLVKREPSPHDGRAVLVSLTPLGRQFTDRCAEQVAERIAGLTAGLSMAEVAQLTELATALVRARA